MRVATDPVTRRFGPDGHRQDSRPPAGRPDGMDGRRRREVVQRGGEGASPAELFDESTVEREPRTQEGP